MHVRRGRDASRHGFLARVHALLAVLLLATAGMINNLSEVLSG